MENLKHVKELYDVDEKDRICDVCHSAMYRVGEEFVRSEVVYEPVKLYVREIYRVSYECRTCRKNNKISRIKAGTPNPVIPHSYASPSALTQIITDKYVNHIDLKPRCRSILFRLYTKTGGEVIFKTSSSGFLYNNRHSQ